MIRWRAVVCVLVVSALVGQVASRLDVLSARRTEKDRLLARKVVEPEHRTLEEVTRELQVSRAKRQSGFGGLPTVDGVHTFDDGYQFARIHYSGDQSNVIFVLTYDYNNQQQLPTRTNLYRSMDYGHSFDSIEENLDPNDNDDPLLWINFYVSDFNKNMLVFPHAISAQMYITLNEGETWRIQTFDPSTLDPRSLVWSPAPTVDNWIIAHDRGNGLYVTQDLGQTWKMISSDVDLFDYQWAVPGVDKDVSTIFFNTIDPDHADNGDVHLYTTKHPYNPEDKQEFDPNLGHHDDFLIVGAYIFAQKTDGNDVSLYVSYLRKPFNQAMIPSEIPHQNYLVSHINSLQAMVIVEHTSGQYNLYLSDSSGVYFSLSLPDIQVEAGVDLELIEGINGTMIANQFVRASPTVTNAPVRTLITFDNGGNWDLVHPPPEFLDGTPTNCEPPLCSLHFHMDSSAYARLGVYSEDTAPGIILAHGTIGRNLSNNPDLYISRDGGINWEETLADSWGVTVADHGGLLVAARDYHQVSSNVLKYSCDEGYSWRDFAFLGGTTMIVFGVITEPGEHTTIVSLYGVELGTGTTRDWTVVTVNFTAIFDRMCTDDDYYDWRPWDMRLGEECILGHSIEIERRRTDRCCLNGRDYVREFNLTICLCTEEDFECDYGYEHADQISGPCVKDPDVNLPDPCANGAQFYVLSSGYRKIAGDVCTGGETSQFAPRNATCCVGSLSPATPASNSSTGGKNSENSGAPAIVLGVMLVIVLIIATGLTVVVCVLFWKLSESRRRYLRLATEPHDQLQRFSFHNDSSDRESPEPDLPPTIGAHSPGAYSPLNEEDDDEPIKP